MPSTNHAQMLTREIPSSSRARHRARMRGQNAHIRPWVRGPPRSPPRRRPGRSSRGCSRERETHGRCPLVRQRPLALLAPAGHADRQPRHAGDHVASILDPGGQRTLLMAVMRDRILTTHVGSLIRPPDLPPWLEARQEGRALDEQAFDATLRRSVADVVRQQAEAGIDIVSDGEFGKTVSWSRYVLE